MKKKGKGKKERMDPSNSNCLGVTLGTIEPLHNLQYFMAVPVKDCIGSKNLLSVQVTPQRNESMKLYC